MNQQSVQPRKKSKYEIRKPIDLQYLLENETDEMERVKRRIHGFNYRNSEVWKILTDKYGPKLAHEELLSIAELLAAKTNITLDRDAKRRKAVLVKWFEENWDRIQGFLQFIILESED